MAVTRQFVAQSAVPHRSQPEHVAGLYSPASSDQEQSIICAQNAGINGKLESDIDHQLGKIKTVEYDRRMKTLDLMTELAQGVYDSIIIENAMHLCYTHQLRTREIFYRFTLSPIIKYRIEQGCSECIQSQTTISDYKTTFWGKCITEDNTDKTKLYKCIFECPGRERYLQGR